MEKIFIWSFLAYGLSTILVYGSIFERPRTWIKAHSSFFGELISCILCTSMWVGMGMSYPLGGLTDQYITTGNFTFFFDGLFTAGIVWAINSFVEFFEENRIK